MNDLGQHLGQFVRTMRTKSAANPALIFAAVCLFFGIGGSALLPEPLNYLSFSIAVIGVVVCAFQILFFTFTDRDRLQDEEHIENKLLINAMNPIVGNSTNIITLEADQKKLKSPDTDQVEKR